MRDAHTLLINKQIKAEFAETNPKLNTDNFINYTDVN